MQTLPALAKAGIVVFGYGAALLVALGVVWAYIEFTAGPQREESGGMYAFGDFLLFVAVFGMVSTIPTIVTLILLRQSRPFWIFMSVAALAVASTSIAEVVAMLAVPQSTNLFVMLAFPRLFMSPFFAAAFGMAAWAAPDRQFRWCLLAAMAMECAGAAYCFFHWFVPLFLSR